MSHSLFISYASPDVAIAVAVCRALEESGIKCWMAPRDISPGADWAAAIVNALDAARTLIVVFSSSADKSEQVLREVNYADTRHLAIIPFRVENVSPTGSLLFILSTSHWLNAWSAPLEPHLIKLVDAVRQVLSSPTSQPAIPESASSTQLVQYHYAKGQVYYQGTSHKDMGWAEKEFRSALQHDPHLAMGYVGIADVDVFRFMSYFDRSAEALERAEANCHRALRIDPKCAQAYRTLGRVYMERRWFEAAETFLQRAIQLNPHFLLAHITLGWCAVEAHDLAAAERAALSARLLDKKNLEVLLLLFRVYYYGKQFDRAISVAEEAIEIDRKSGRAYYDLALSQRALGQFDDARANFERSLEFLGDPNAPLDLGYTELIANRPSRAQKLFNQAVKEKTFGFLASYYIGLIFHLAGKRESARRHWRKSKTESLRLGKHSPTDPYSRIVAAMASAALGEMDVAGSMISEAIDLDPKDGLVAFYGACALTWGGDRERAVAAMQTALTLPRSPSEVEVARDPHFLTAP